MSGDAEPHAMTRRQLIRHSAWFGSAVVLTVAVYVFLCGCGTMLNLHDKEQKFYGGVRLDAEAATV